MSRTATLTPNHASAARASGAARSTVLWVFIILGALLVAGALTATSVGDLFGLRFTSAPVNPAAAGAPPPVEAQDDAPFGLDDVRRVIAVLGEAERAKVVDDKAAFAQLVQREAARRSLIRAAKDAGLDARSEVAFLMRRSAEQVLVDAYVQLNAGSALSADFPSEAQVRAFYEGNKSRYRLDERIPVWQIFLSTPEGADEGAVAAIEKRAKSAAQALESGKLSFAEAAANDSEHAPSRHNGGFMGNLKVTELIPEVKAAVLEAKPGEIFGPVRSASGFHLLKRGERLEAETIPLSQVEARIRAALRKAAENRAREAVIDRARQQFGVAITDADLEAWRQALGRPGAGD